MIGRICIFKSTGKLLEFQSGMPELGTLIKNAIKVGYNSDDIEERYVDTEEWELLERRWVIPSPLLESEIIISGTDVEIPEGDFYYMGEKYEMEATGILDFSKPETKLSIEYLSSKSAQYVYDTTGLSPLSNFENGLAITIVQVIDGSVTVMI